MLLLQGPHSLWASSVKRWKRQFLELTASCGWPAVPSGRATMSPPGTGSVLLAPPLLHIFSPSNPTKPTASTREEGIAARLAGRDRACLDLSNRLVLNVRWTVPFHNIRLSPGYLSKIAHATVLWVDKTSRGGPGEGQVSEGVKTRLSPDFWAKMEAPGASPQSRLWYLRVPGQGLDTEEARTEQPHGGTPEALSIHWGSCGSPFLS